MRIDKIIIEGYRRFNKSVINLNHGNFAILAGANNSGKTSLIQLLDIIFNNKSRKSVSFKDFSIRLKSLLDNKVKELDFSSDFNNEKFIEFIDYINEQIKIKVQFELSYDLEESIGLFANYLMDLDDDKRNFYFEYNYKLNTEVIKEEFVKQDIKSSMILQEIIEQNTESIYFYADKDFNNKKIIEYKDFKKLFHFEYISADRELDDENLKNKKITTSIISSSDSTSRDSVWNSKFDELKNKIANDLAESEIDSRFQKETQKILSDLKDSLDNVSKNEIEALEAKFHFNEKNLLNLIKDSLLINYSHSTDEFLFSLTEESQGLGISNLIYMSLQIDRFSRTIQPNTVNLFVIEEPEAHMHIQMQKVLVSYIETIFSSEKNLQGIITTHSTEIVKNVDVNDIKVIRSENNFMNRIVDLHQFINNNGEKEFYETFFKLNFADLIFSDAVIFYEGDAERMYFESLINRKNSNYSNLARQYLSYCQCGGDYANKYFPLLNELRMTACVFTDIDYDKEREELEGIDSDKSTNTTLNSILPADNKKVADIYQQQSQEREKNIEIFTQTDRDGFARTLEDALLYKMISLTEEIESVFEKFNKLEWDKFNESFELTLPNITSGKECSMKREEIYNRLEISKENRKIDYLRDNHTEECAEYEEFKETCEPKRSIRDIVSIMDKTNFMYSIIFKDKVIEVLPNYIEEGLTWLNNKITSTI